MFSSRSKMAADLKKSTELCSLDLLVLHENDGLFITYSDGTSLELSPCGSAFLHRQASPSNSIMRQLTRFAVSSFRSKITEAVRIRNLFAARPYLCKELADQQDLKVGYQDVTQCCWPDHTTTDLITKLPDGSSCITSVDGLASLTLMPHRQAFIVRFLAEVKYSLPQKARNTCRETDVQQQKCYFTWQEQIHSLFSYPEAWKYPLQLALDAVNNEQRVTPCLPHNVTILPASLPVTCSAVHLHKWKAQSKVPTDSSSMDWEFFGQSNMKLIWKDGATYRIFRQSTGLFTIEIDPGDGSVMRSQSPRGRYFDHWFVQKNGCEAVEIQERVYSADKPLPDRLLHRTEYSVCRLVKQAARYIEFLSNAGQQLEDRCCWKEAIRSTTLVEPCYQAHVVDTADVPGTGRFKAYSNGHVNVVFSDRTILDIRHSTVNKENTLENCWCQLILPNGAVQHLRLADAKQYGAYEQYIQTAVHWAEWVKATPSQRRTFYKDTIWDPEKRRAVDVEVEKIKRFNYIHNQQNVANLAQRTLLDTDNSNDKVELKDEKDFANISDLPDRETMIKSVLQQTNRAIDDIDGLLTTLKCSPQNIQSNN